MKLTKLQRFTAYCIILAEYDEHLRLKNINGRGLPYYKRCGGYCKGLCDILANLLHDDENLLNITDVYGLTELNRFRKEICYWFDSDKHRIAALKQCIIETHP